jgi:hypothetical protein
VIRESEAQGVAVWKSTAILTTVLTELKTEEGRATICLFIVFSSEVLGKGRLRVYKIEQNRTAQEKGGMNREGREWKERMLLHLILTSHPKSHHRAGQVGAGLLGLAAAAILFELLTRP